MRITRWSVSVAAAVVLALCLAGCQAGGVEVPPGAEQLSPCEISEIPIDELDEMGTPECDLAGSSLVLSDGTPTIMIPAVGAAFSQGDGNGREFRIVNWGVPGVHVAAIEGDRLVGLWASGPEAEDLAWQQLAVERVETTEWCAQNC